MIVSRPRPLLAAGVVLLSTACAPRAVDPGAADVARDGRAIAQAQCGGCHAPGLEGESARTDAPPLRALFGHYRADTLTEEFIAGIKVGHPDMPLFDMNPQGVDALVAYIKSIQEPPSGGRDTPQ